MLDQKNKMETYHKTSFPSLIGKFLIKSKRYHNNNDHMNNTSFFSKENEDPQCIQNLMKLHKQKKRHLLLKINRSLIKNHCNTQLPFPSQDYHLLKNLKEQLKSYMNRMEKKVGEKQGEYQQFSKLCIQSKDYLYFYFKNQFKKETVSDFLSQTSHFILLSFLKNYYRCLSDNPHQITHRILLALDINPLNDFHFVQWTSFSVFRKLAFGTYSKLQAKLFLAKYLMPDDKNLKRREFWAIIGTIMRKLEKVINQNNAQRFFERVEALGTQFLPQQITKDKLHQLLASEHIFIWEELISLIFLL